MRLFRKKMPLRDIFKRRLTPYLVIAVTVAIVVSLFAVPAFSVSSNQCSSSSCHPGAPYNMQLDILEGNSQNIIPSSIQVGQTLTVSVVIENINNAPMYNQFSSVYLTLSSQNGHFSVNTPTFNVGTLPTGTATATWQITGVSQGSDALLISASATNTHEYLQYSDSYSPSTSITVTPNSNPNYTPPPSPTPTSTPTPTPSPPTPTDSPQPTANPTVASTPAPTQTTPNPTSTNTPTPTPNTSPSAGPTTQPSPNPTSSTPQTKQDTTQPNPDSLNSPMLYIHPPLAIIGYVLIFAFAILVLKKDYFERRITKLAGRGLWLFTLLGLLTGMLWAQSAWGSYWSWDPKETMTLALFLAASAGQLFYFEKKYTATKWLALLSCALVILTGLSSFIIAGLHSYL